MKRAVLAAAAALFTASFGSSVCAADLAQCKKVCDDAYAVCSNGNANPEKCLPAWHQCKSKCSGATPVAQAAAPAGLQKASAVTRVKPAPKGKP